MLIQKTTHTQGSMQPQKRFMNLKDQVYHRPQIMWVGVWPTWLATKELVQAIWESIDQWERHKISLRHKLNSRNYLEICLLVHKEDQNILCKLLVKQNWAYISLKSRVPLQALSIIR